MPLDICERALDGLIFDGGIGSSLIALGLPAGTLPEQWNITHARQVKNLHAKYFSAGAEVATTNSFGANMLKLKAFHIDSQIHLINKRAAELARSVCPDDKYVIGSMGPTGKLMVAPDHFTQDDFFNSFLPQAEGLLEGRVDAFLVETQYQLQEALGAIAAIRSITDRPIIATMTFKKYSRGYFTMTGD
ncbi:MAG: homocysteine S-methyltransferase family protein, partial [Candidatus Ranarchaeia archaeon]